VALDTIRWVVRQGSLFLTDKSICFASALSSRRWIIPLADVLSVEKKKHGGFSTAIQCLFFCFCLFFVFLFTWLMNEPLLFKKH
jgi:hypothetical protein